MDEIDYGIIKKLPIKNELILLDIYNEILVTNSYPPEWSKLFVHFIKKNQIIKAYD